MGIPYRARVDERAFLNLPGFRGASYVYVYVEDTTERVLQRGRDCEPDCDCCPFNFEPRMIFELDGNGYAELKFDVDTEEGRANTLHKLDTLIAAVRVLRAGIVAEFEEYDRRERELEQLRSE
jgi:hypothetical protein